MDLNLAYDIVNIARLLEIQVAHNSSVVDQHVELRKLGG
jgi:hypothetical protein